MENPGAKIIKVQLGGDIRRIQVDENDINLAKLIGTVKRIFQVQLNGKQNIAIRYKDEDGDIITIAGDCDLAIAIKHSRSLKLVLVPADRSLPDAGQPMDGEDLVLDICPRRESARISTFSFCIPDQVS